MAQKRKPAPTHDGDGLPVETPTYPVTIRLQSREWLAIRVVAEIRGVRPAELYRRAPLERILASYDRLMASSRAIGMFSDL